MAPKVTVNNLNLGIKSKHVHIKLHGGILIDLAKIVKPLIQGVFVKKIIRKAEDSITSLINNDLNHELFIWGTETALPNNIQVIADYSQIGDSPVISDNLLRFDLNGTFFNDESGEPVKGKPVSFTKVNTTGEEVWAIISTYTITTYNKAMKSSDVTTAAVENALDELVDIDDLTLKDLIEEVNKGLTEFQLPSSFGDIDPSRIWVKIGLGWVAGGLKYPSPSDWEALAALFKSMKAASTEPEILQN